MPIVHTKLPKLTPQEIQRFWSNVNKEPGQGPNGDCWQWRRCKRRWDYGIIKFNYQRYSATRIAYFLSTGIDPGELQVCHTCDNPACCYFPHLFLGTQADNMADMVRKGRSTLGDKNGSRLHPEKMPRGDRHYSRTSPEKLARGDNNGSRKYPEKVKRGIESNLTKLTESQVIEIRRLFSEGMRFCEITRQLNIPKDNVRIIARRKSWKHIP